MTVQAKEKENKQKSEQNILYFQTFLEHTNNQVTMKI